MRGLGLLRTQRHPDVTAGDGNREIDIPHILINGRRTGKPKGCDGECNLTHVRRRDECRRLHGQLERHGAHVEVIFAGARLNSERKRDIACIDRVLKSRRLNADGECNVTRIDEINAGTGKVSTRHTHRERDISDIAIGDGRLQDIILKKRKKHTFYGNSLTAPGRQGRQDLNHISVDRYRDISHIGCRTARIRHGAYRFNAHRRLDPSIIDKIDSGFRHGQVVLEEAAQHT